MSNLNLRLKPYLWKFTGMYLLALFITVVMLVLLKSSGIILEAIIPLFGANYFLAGSFCKHKITCLDEVTRHRIVKLTTAITVSIQSVFSVVIIVFYKLMSIAALKNYNALKNLNSSLLPYEQLKLSGKIAHGLNLDKKALSNIPAFITKSSNIELIVIALLLVILISIVFYLFQNFFWRNKFLMKMLRRPM